MYSAHVDTTRGLSLCLSVSLSLCLIVCLSACLPVCLPVCLYPRASRVWWCTYEYVARNCDACNCNCNCNCNCIVISIAITQTEVRLPDGRVLPLPDDQVSHLLSDGSVAHTDLVSSPRRVTAARAAAAGRPAARDGARAAGRGERAHAHVTRHVRVVGTWHPPPNPHRQL